MKKTGILRKDKESKNRQKTSDHTTLSTNASTLSNRVLTVPPNATEKPAQNLSTRYSMLFVVLVIIIHLFNFGSFCISKQATMPCYAVLRFFISSSLIDNHKTNSSFIPSFGIVSCFSTSHAFIIHSSNSVASIPLVDPITKCQVASSSSVLKAIRWCVIVACSD